MTLSFNIKNTNLHHIYQQVNLNYGRGNLLLSRHWRHSPNINPASEITIHRQLSLRVINKIPIGSADDESRVEYLNMMTLYSSTQNMPPLSARKPVSRARRTTFISVTVPLGGLSRADRRACRQHQSNQNNIPGVLKPLPDK
jgi:hypothetical protein